MMSPSNPDPRVLRRWPGGWWWLMPLWLAGCGGPLVEVTLVDERTALENQVLGNYAELDQEVQLLGSVRGIAPDGAVGPGPAMTPQQRVAVRAMQRIAFNKDDLERFKRTGAVGENNRGGVTLLEPERLDEGERAFAAALVTEENADREAVMARMIEAGPGLSAQDLPRLRALFAALFREKSPAEGMVQLEDGSWRARKPPTTPDPP